MIQIGCDGCGHTSSNKDDFKVVGFVQPMHYCKEKCVPVVEEYLKGRDNAHTATVVYWNKNNKKNIAKFQKQHPNFKFPDIT